jgi:hypothetical protein
MQFILVANHHDLNLMTLKDAVADHANALVLERLPLAKMIAGAKN